MSVISLDKQLYMDIKIDNQDIPSGMPNFLEEVTIIENVAGVPVMAMTVNDTRGMFSNTMPLTDSNKFTITIGTSMEDMIKKDPFNFRLFNWRGDQYQQGFKYRINAIFDNYKFIKNVKSKAYKGSSNTVLQQVASDCGLKFVGSGSCADSQTWLNFADPLSTFTRKVVQHSFLQNGCMSTAITADGKLIYKDIISALNSKPVGELNTHNPSPSADFKKVFLIKEFSPSSSAGFMNAWLNFGYIVVEDFLSGSNESYTATTLTSTSGGSVVINKDVSGSLDATRKDYVVQDAGNTHAKYWRAYHNNLRVLGLFSQKLVFLVDEVTGFMPLDVIDIKVLSGNSGIPTAYTSKYIIGAKKTMIRGTKYAEIFEVYKNTVPKAGTAKLSNDSPPAGVHNINADASKLPDMDVVATGFPPLPPTNYQAPQEATYVPTFDTVASTIEPSSNQTTTKTNTSGGDGSDFLVVVKDLGDRV